MLVRACGFTGNITGTKSFSKQFLKVCLQNEDDTSSVVFGKEKSVLCKPREKTRGEGKITNNKANVSIH